MPLYAYKFTDETGGEFEEVQSMREDALTEKNGRPCRRMPQLSTPRTRFGKGNSAEPIEMLSIALDNEDEIRDFRVRNPGVEISHDRRDRNFGVPIAKSRSEKLKVLRNEGFREKNGISG